MRRRQFITLLGGAAAWPLVARAQQPAVPVIGYLGSGSPEQSGESLAMIRQVLAASGYVEGRNVAFEPRYADGQYDRLTALAADLVRRQVAVIVATPFASARAAQAATMTIPIVFSSGADPVKYGLVASLSRPGGNLTGVSQLTIPLYAKRMDLLRELVPNAGIVGVLINDANPAEESTMTEVETAARTIKQEILVVNANNDREMESAFATLVQRRASALLVGGGAFFGSRRGQLAELAARHAIPAIYTFREFAAAGGLISYATSVADINHQIGVYVGRILKGEKPADLPVVQPTKFDLVINLKTAKALGLTVPPNLLATAGH
jgi:putative ABC transport system substrate-binding protein